MNNYLQIFMSSYTFKIVTLGCMLLGIISAIVGSFAVLKKESLLGDGVSHASLAGVCLAFLLSGEKEMWILLLGALLTGIICISLIHFIQLYSKIKFDSALSLTLSSFFGLGLVLLTYLKKVPGAKKAGLNNFIFGQAATLITKDIYLISAIGLILLILILLFWKEIKISIFDTDYAQSLGIPSSKIKFFVSFLIVINIIIGIQIAGVILMTAMILIPAVAARYWTDRLNVLVIIAAFIGAVSGGLGSIISTLDTALPTGPIIILVSSTFFFISLVFSLKRGLILNLFRNYERNKKIRAKFVGSDKK